LDLKDERAQSYAHLMKILPKINFQYIVFENVQGFELSIGRKLLVDTLKECQFRFQEFLITPTVVGIPNSRPRYYLIGKKSDMSWCFETTDSIMETMPLWNEPLEKTPYVDIVKKEQQLWRRRRERLVTKSDLAFPAEWCIGDIIDWNLDPSKFRLSDATISKYGLALDIVNPRTAESDCFTGAYGRYVKGTGSVLDLGALTPEAQNNVLKHDLRFFTPAEVGRLMCYPEGFRFPAHFKINVLYRAIGNSVNVYVVSLLMALVLTGV